MFFHANTRCNSPIIKPLQKFPVAPGYCGPPLPAVSGCISRSSDRSSLGLPRSPDSNVP